jgi:hypothetical protein
MLMFVDTEKDWSKVSDEERGRMFQSIGEWWGRHSSAGTIVGGEQLQPAATAKTVVHEGGRTVVTDGPFIEAKERIGGYAIVDVPSEAEALELARTWPAGGKVEVRPLVAMEMDHAH